MTRRQSSRAKVTTMLLALEAQVRHAESFSRRLENQNSSKSFTAYRSFRRKIDEVLALSTLIEARIEELKTTDVDSLSRQFSMLNLTAIRVLVNYDLLFFNYWVGKEHIPIGTKEALEKELSFLKLLPERIQKWGSSNTGVDSIIGEVHNIESFINNISSRTVGLEDFSDSPSLAEWTGQQRIPTRQILTSRIRT